MIVITILKIIGLILLALLCLILILLILPVRYRLRAESADGVAGICAGVNVTALCRLVSVTVDYQAAAEDSLQLAVRLLGIPIIRGGSRKEPGEKKKRMKNRANDPELAALEEEAKEKKRLEKEKEKSLREEENRILKGLRTDRHHIKETKRIRQEIRQRRLTVTLTKVRDGILDFGRMLVSLPAVIVRGIGAVFNRWSETRRTVRLYRKFLGDERTKAALRQALDLVKCSVKHLLPRRIEGNLRFGFDDPAKTGIVLAAAESFYPVWCRTLTLTPDFEAQVFMGHIAAAGRMIPGYLVIKAIGIYFNKNIQFVIHFFKRLKAKKEKKHGR